MLKYCCFSGTGKKKVQELKDTLILILMCTKQPHASPHLHTKQLPHQSLNESNPPCSKLSGS